MPFVLTNTTGLIESLDYPEPYPNGQCQWQIDVTEDVPYVSSIFTFAAQGIVLNSTGFSLEGP